MTKVAYPLSKAHMKTVLVKALNARRRRVILGDDQEMLRTLMFYRVKMRSCNSGQQSNTIIERQLVNELLDTGIEQLKHYDPLYADILICYFSNQESDEQVSNRFNWSRPTIRRRRRDAIDSLADLLYLQETKLRTNLLAQISDALPTVNNDRLFGRQEDVANISDMIIHFEQHKIIVLSGIGGIGKTAVALAVTQSVMPHFKFEQIVWISADSASDVQSPFGAPSQAKGADFLLSLLIKNLDPDKCDLSFEQQVECIQTKLKERPHLIALDDLNLDTDAFQLLARLVSIAKSSKFLITSRTVAPKVDLVYSHPLGPIDEKSAEDLFRWQFDKSCRRILLDDTDVLNKFFCLVGGHPASLRLVANQASTFSVHEVLESIENIYANELKVLCHTIHCPVWNQLSESAQHILEMMLLFDKGGAEQKQLFAANNLTNQQLWTSIQQLTEKSLLQVNHRGTRITYSIHRVTKLFLRMRQQENGYGPLFMRSTKSALQYWSKKLNTKSPSHKSLDDIENVRCAIAFGAKFDECEDLCTNLQLRVGELVEC